MNLYELIAQIILKYGIKVFYVILFSCAAYLAWTKSYKYLFNKIFNRRKSQNNYKQKDLYNHHLFQKLRTYLSYEIQYLVIGERLREAVFRDLLIIMFTSIKNEFLHFLEKGNIERMDSSLYRTRILGCIDNIMKEYKEKARKNDIPEIVLIKFDEWYRDYTEAIYSFIKDIDNDRTFLSNAAKTSVIFDFMVHVLNMTVVNARKTLVHLNGELDGTMYKGIVCQKMVKNV